jgi:hypothetical protein
VCHGTVNTPSRQVSSFLESRYKTYKTLPFLTPNVPGVCHMAVAHSEYAVFIGYFPHSDKTNYLVLTFAVLCGRLCLKVEQGLGEARNQ